MLSENIKALRKAKGYSQEELASRLHVVRQTVSKWEKGLSVPDADMLVKIADILETDTTTLLDSTTDTNSADNQVAQQLGLIAEQMAIKNRRAKLIWKTILFILGALLLLYIFSLAAFTATKVSPEEYAVVQQQFP